MFIKPLWPLGALLLVAAVSFAQSPLPPAAIEAPKAPQEELKLLPDSGDYDKATLVQQSQQTLERMQQGVDAIDKRREEAQKDKDLIKLNCLSAKAARAREHLEEARGALKVLKDSTRQSDGTARTFVANRIRIYHQKVLVLVGEADNCVGEEASYVGPSHNEVEVDPTVPKGDPTDPGLPTPTATLAPVGVEEAVRDSPSSNSGSGSSNSGSGSSGGGGGGRSGSNSGSG